MRIRVREVHYLLRRSLAEGKKDPEKVRRRYLRHNDPGLARDVRRVVVRMLETAVRIGKLEGDAGLVGMLDDRLVEAVQDSPEFWFISEDIHVLGTADGIDAERVISRFMDLFFTAVFDEMVFMAEVGELDNGPPGSERYVVPKVSGLHVDGDRILRVPPGDVVDTISYEVHLRIVDAVRERYDFDQLEKFDRRYGAEPRNLRVR